MTTIRQLLEQRIKKALLAVGIPDGFPAMVAPAGRPEFGDYQANGVMAAAKSMKTNPRALAEKVIEQLDLSDIAKKVEIAGPGFINISLSDDWLGKQLLDNLGDEHLGVPKPPKIETIVVDYSHPNLAKEMHVGHLRSTIIGDAIVRILEFLGHEVIRHNHVGDWGTQFGMLIAYMVRLKNQGETTLSTELQDLETFYRAAKTLFDKDPEFADTAREYVVKLQQGDAHCRELWHQFIEESLHHCERIYEQLDITLTRADVKPESSYNDDLPKVIDDLRKAGLLTESQGAQCVFLDEFIGKDGKPLPVIVRKTDGGYLYATTDLAAARYRANVLKADRILYIVDARQTLHLNQVFAIARKAHFVPESCSLEHHAFGTMMGQDGKPFKTREGGTVKLMHLLNEAERRAFDLVTEKNPELSEQQRQQIAHVVGMGAVKYADLSKNRTSDYIFNWDTMLSLEGNTAPYLQYAFTRVQSIFKKGGLESISTDKGEIIVGEPSERTLAIKLLQFAEVLEVVAKDCYPNSLCSYLYELSGAFMSFYEACPVLKAEQPIRTSRLTLSLLTAKTIQTGLGLLGIKTLEQM